MKTITAKFNSKCAETGKALRKGDTIVYDPETRKAYHLDSRMAKAEAAMQSNDAQYVAAQENAYFDNFCQANGI